MEYPYDELLILPEAGELKEAEPKRFVQDVDTELLKGMQKDHFNSLREFVNKDGFGFMLLEGYAGTGKTFLISMVVEWILKNRKGKVAMTAPTNKAVKVLKNAGQYQDANLHYCTIHSLLGLREQITPKGQQIFVQLNKEHASIGEYDILVVDEVSMLSDELLLGAEKITGIFDYVKMFNLKVIFVGDPCQIPPIGKENCLPFIPEKREQYGIGRLVLTDIVRQSQDNPIIKVTLEVRTALGREVVLPIREDDFNPENLDGVYFMDGDKIEEFWKLIEVYFTSQNFKNRSDFAKIVAYQNKTVRSFNTKVRKYIYGLNAPKICIGEKLIANKPIASTLEDTILFNNNDEFEVVDFTIAVQDYKGAELTYYDTIVRDTGLYTDTTKKIKIIHESSEEDYKLILDHLVELAKAEKSGSWAAATLWKDFFRIQEVFADVNYNYAITAHKSQGSTYDNCFVLEADMDINKKIKERNRIKYTSFTRPKHKLFVIE